MGIKHLNNFLIENCSTKAIYKTSLRQFTNKTVVIDTSIYLYKFAEKGAVAENIYLLISVFREYNITPVFIFDGKPPVEKKAMLIKRKIEKDAAEEKYNELKATIGSAQTPEVVSAITTEMETLKKQFVRVSELDIRKSKEIMTAYGVEYIESQGESDHLCAFLVKHGFAWACVSDDMDMFLYGCPRVLRHLSLLNHEAIYYDTTQILTDLDMTQGMFNDIAILAGTDYNTKEQRSLSDIVRLYMEYLSWTHYTNLSKTFYEWLIDVKKYITDVDSLILTRRMFDLDIYLETHRDEFRRIVDMLPFKMGDYRVEELQNVLMDNGFIFV